MFTIGLTLEKQAFRIAILKKEKKTIAIELLQTLPLGHDHVYRVRAKSKDFDSARQSQIEAQHSERGGHSRMAMSDEKDRSGKVAASQNLYFSPECGIKQFYNLPPFHTGKEAGIVSGLAGSDIFIRKLHLPLREKRKILAALPFQLESLIPYENPIVCPLLKPLSKQMTAVTIVATSSSQLSSHLAALKEMDIEPDTVSCSPMALGRFARWQFPQEFRILCFDFRDQKISCVLLEGDELVLSQTIPNSDLELEKFSVFLKQKGAIDDQTPWTLTGEFENFSESVGRVFPGKRLEVAHEPALYAIPIGLALDALAADRSSVQFCQKEFIPAHTIASRKKKMLSYLGLCLIAGLLMTAGGTFCLNKKQNKLIENLQNYCPSKESFSSLNQIEEKLREWESSLQGQKTTFAFLPTVPKVSDVLAWLSAHPAFATEEGGQKEGMEIKSLHYSLVKYPKIGEAASPYAAQVELEFTSAAPRTARDFHEALLKGDQIVNAKKEVKWQTQNQTYHTIFELNKGTGS